MIKALPIAVLCWDQIYIQYWGVNTVSSSVLRCTYLAAIMFALVSASVF